MHDTISRRQENVLWLICYLCGCEFWRWGYIMYDVLVYIAMSSTPASFRGTRLVLERYLAMDGQIIKLDSSDGSFHPDLDYFLW